MVKWGDSRQVTILPLPGDVARTVLLFIIGSVMVELSVVYLGL